jgi:hypothetical protein
MSVKSVVFGTIFILSALLPAQAQVTVDVTKINCDQFVHHKITEPNLIAAWFSGYYMPSATIRLLIYKHWMRT